MQVTIELADNEVVVRIGIPAGQSPTVVQQVTRTSNGAAAAAVQLPKAPRRRKDPKYQAGDRVRVIGFATRYGVPRGWEGAVQRIATSGPMGWSYDVLWDDDNTVAKISESTIERVVQP